MKIKLLFLVLLVTVFTACKNENKKDVNLEENRAKSFDQNDGLITLKGDFVYFADAAVLQTPREIYGVVIDDNLHLLDKQVKTFKKEATDMVPVTVRVRKFEKKEDEEGWQYLVEIKEILKVEAPKPNPEDVIKLVN